MVLTEKVKIYGRKQGLVDLLAYLVFTLGTVIISTSIALFLLRSPVYGIIGIIPILFYRPRPFIKRAAELDKKIKLHGELVNSIQLSSISEESKERYSRELIQGFISATEEKIKGYDLKKYISYNLLARAGLFLLVAIAFCLIYPAFFPGRFWYSLNHQIGYRVEPDQNRYLKGTEIDIRLSLFGPYLPKDVHFITTKGNRRTQERIRIEDGLAQKSVILNEPLEYLFEFLEYKTEARRLSIIEPLFIQNLQFHLHYPKYINLKDEIKTTKELIALVGTRVSIKGQASQVLDSAFFEFGDTTMLSFNKSEFSGEFVIHKTGTAMLHLFAATQLKEPIRIYAIPDAAPLVDIFYPGYDINMPSDMKITMGIKCSDDYGLANAFFYYNLKSEEKIPLKLKKGATEDTIYYEWNLANLGMLPGDEVGYYVKITDNAGNTTKSKTYYIYFPTMEQMYKEISKTAELIQEDLKNIKETHQERMEEIRRIEQKIMKERDISWLDKEKLKEVISKEEKILDKVDEWRQELEKTIEKLNETFILDQESIARLQEIAKILEEIAPEEFRRALENLELQLDKDPEHIRKALEDLKDAQEELARALKRTLEILRRFQQEEKLKELAEIAKELSERAGEIGDLMADGKEQELERAKQDLYEGIDSLGQGIEKLAESEGLEQEIKDALQELAQDLRALSQGAEMQMAQTQEDLNRTAQSLERLYEELTKSRAAKLRKNLLETMNHLIEISKSEERLLQAGILDPELQSQIINATKLAAESLYTQQVKSLYVTPQMGKRLTRAIKEMEKARDNYKEIELAKASIAEAMKQLNLTCLEILESLKKGSQAGSSTGMDQFLQSLSQIGQGQMALSQSLMSIFPIPVTGLTGEQMAQLQRLAGKQRELRMALERLGNEPGAGRYQELLDHLSKEMKEMEEALYQYKLDRKLIERQQLIISRLLDTQRSIREKGYHKERKSRPGKDIIRASPLPLAKDLGRDELREIIQKALKEPYPKEYELYIREYFKALLEER